MRFRTAGGVGFVGNGKPEKGHDPNVYVMDAEGKVVRVLDLKAQEKIAGALDKACVLHGHLRCPSCRTFGNKKKTQSYAPRFSDILQYLDR